MENQSDVIRAANIYPFVLGVEGYPGKLFSTAGSLGLSTFDTEDRSAQAMQNVPHGRCLSGVWHSIAVILRLCTARRLELEGHLSSVNCAFVGTAM